MSDRRYRYLAEPKLKCNMQLWNQVCYRDKSTAMLGLRGCGLILRVEHRTPNGFVRFKISEHGVVCSWNKYAGHIPWVVMWKHNGKITNAPSILQEMFHNGWSLEQIHLWLMSPNRNHRRLAIQWDEDKGYIVDAKLLNSLYREIYE